MIFLVIYRTLKVSTSRFQLDETVGFSEWDCRSASIHSTFFSKRFSANPYATGLVLCEKITDSFKLFDIINVNIFRARGAARKFSRNGSVEERQQQ